jgi:hypothetical protein
MITVGRHINGITLNGLEYLLDDNGEIMQFRSKGKAKKWLFDAGCSADELYWLVFEQVKVDKEREADEHVQA